VAYVEISHTLIHGHELDLVLLVAAMAVLNATTLQVPLVHLYMLHFIGKATSVL